ncbi:MAG: response regulator [Deltaproteobacteria bacterium]|nr:response regulator [Deltaproteobacteria bacterium]
MEALGMMGSDTTLKPRYRLLVAEDDKALRDMMVALLRADRYEVVAVGNGIDLLHTLKVSLDTKPETQPFDLVISDVRMPGRSGPRAFAEIGYGPRVPPVLFITAFGDEELREEALRVGALGVLDKPVDFDELRDFIRGYLVTKRN